MMCAAAAGRYRARGLFEASRCHDTNLILRASWKTMARYTADSGSARKKKEREGERQVEGE